MYNPFSLEGKTILVTGASSGIGRQTAIECAKLGARVVLTARNVERLQAVLRELEGEGHSVISADLTNEEDIKRLVDACPQLDGLVSNAGVSVNRPVAFYAQKDFDKVFAANAFAPMILNRWLLKKKKLNVGASVVFTSSTATIKSTYGNGIYASSKAALTTYMRYFAREMTAKQMRANTVHPGMIETPLIHGGAFSEEDLRKDAERYPLRRYGRAEEVAWAIIYFLSDASAWTTGTGLFVDGGISLT